MYFMKMLNSKTQATEIAKINWHCKVKLNTEITFLITCFHYYKNMMSTYGQNRQKAIAGISSEIK